MLTIDLLLCLQLTARLPITQQAVYMPPPGVSLLDCQTVLADEGYEYVTTSDEHGFMIAGFVHTHTKIPLSHPLHGLPKLQKPKRPSRITTTAPFQPTISQRLKEARAQDRPPVTPATSPAHPSTTPSHHTPKTNQDQPTAHLISVRSDTNPQESHTVSVNAEGRAMKCTCTAGKNRTPCKHLYRAEVKACGIYQRARAHILASGTTQDTFEMAFAARVRRDGMNAAIAWTIASAFPDHDLATVPQYPRRDALAHATATHRDSFKPSNATSSPTH